VSRIEPVSFPFDDAGCFGCSSRNPDGLQLEFARSETEIVGTYLVPDRFHGAPGVAHGGIVATILDEYSCAAAVFLRGKRVVTGELSVRYEQPCPVEKPLTIRSWVADESHARYLVIEAQVSAGDEVLVRSTGKFFPQELDQPAP
jgi:acyl-coenzyme A thioesterase PaaI-like protein